MSTIVSGSTRSMSRAVNLFFFFFQAEDGIRDVAVTGVQTCALPIYLLAQILTQRLPVALRAPLGGAVVLIEEIALALQILEHAQVVVAVLPGVGDEDPDWIALRHPRESGTSAGAAKLVHPERAAASRRVPGARAGRRRSRRPRRRGLE